MLLNRLKPNPKNPRILKKDEFERLKKKIKSFPEMLEKRPIVYDGDIVLGGNQRLQVLKELVKEGFEIKDNYFADASSWSDEQKRQFVITDNISDGNWDYDVLANEWDDLPLEEWGINTSGWGNIEEDEAPELQEGEPESKVGEVYELGRHRLMCGDATKVEDVEKLMGGKVANILVTDPPYGVNYAAKNKFLNKWDGGNRSQKDIENDDIEDYRKWFGEWLSFLPTFVDNVFYIFMGGQRLHELREAMEDSKLKWGDYLIWVKNNHVLGLKDYKSKHEYIVYGWPKTHKFYGGFKTTIFNYDKPLKNDLHPTMKPVALCADLIKDGSQLNGIVLDLFLGSASTMVACHQTNRICYGLEIDPKYVDVGIKRMLNLQPDLELKRDGEIIDKTPWLV